MVSPDLKPPVKTSPAHQQFAHLHPQQLGSLRVYLLLREGEPTSSSPIHFPSIDPLGRRTPPLISGRWRSGVVRAGCMRCALRLLQLCAGGRRPEGQLRYGGRRRRQAARCPVGQALPRAPITNRNVVEVRLTRQPRSLLSRQELSLAAVVRGVKPSGDLLVTCSDPDPLRHRGPVAGRARPAPRSLARSASR
jgi:hypothetical protein